MQRSNASLAAARRAAQTALRIALRVRHDGMLAATALTVLACFVMVAFGSLVLGALKDNTDASAGLLLLAPGAALMWLVRPEEHRLMSRMLRGTRLLVLLSAGCAFVSTATLVSGFSGPALIISWISCSVLAFLAAVGVGAAWKASYNAARMKGKFAVQKLLTGQSEAARSGQEHLPGSLAEAASDYGFDLHGLYAESAESFRSGWPGMNSDEQVQLTMRRVAAMAATRR